jgi:thiamine-monophosphate kinase
MLELLGPMLRRHTAGLPLGTGDDVAITGDRLVWTIDSMIEGTHFRWYDDPLCTPEAIATKLVASNVSDLCSKGATPLYALLSFGVPADTPVERIRRFYAGLDASLLLHGARLLGGDTVGAPQWCLTLTVVGFLPPGLHIAARSGARPGMAVYTTGWPGESGAGFELLNRPEVKLDPAVRAQLVARHLAPTVDPALARRLVESLAPLAMIDLSDGLAKDCGELARASDVGLVIESIPCSDPLRTAAQARGKSAEQYALFGGEDYELLFCTAAPEEAVRAAAAPGLIHRIGRVVEGAGVQLERDGMCEPLTGGGFDHYA